MTLDQILDFLTKGGLLGALLGAGLGGYKGIWYWGNEVRKREAEALERLNEVKADRDEWKQMALSAIPAAEKIANGKVKP